MKLKDLYSKPINRPVNPAVSATKFDEDTEKTEIEEYVFTDEIMNGLFRILNAIKNNQHYDHVGIWIDGYYGSGKSHFLKYLDYCITPHTRDKALQRFIDAVDDIDPFDEKHNLGFGKADLQDIAGWLKRATIDTCIFNLETSYDNSTDKRVAFLNIFWNEFNGKRGFNKFNLSLAQHLEKPLADKGVFEQFKQRIMEEGDADWNDANVAASIVDNELDWVLDIAKELAPTLDKESIRKRIENKDTVISIDRFGMELAAYLKDKGDDYRLIFLADEVSQFINKERDRYLNLQEIITKLSEACDNKVWVACTAQQDLSEIMDDCHIAEEKDTEGKIKGRFEVKVSLKGTQPEVITQKRILDKKEIAKAPLADLYEQQKAAFSLQFKLPNAYESFNTKDDFIDYYPFVPYQFKLIMQVFNSFLALGYVAKEVKGNERSIIKVIHSTAKANADAELGKIVSFDELYNNMFEEGLQNRGQKAVQNAIDKARLYDRDPKLAIRVVYVLFMVCNISKTDQLVFPATLENVTSLLINDFTTPRLTIKSEVEKILDYLCNGNIIRLERGKEGQPDRYSFYSEEEMKEAALIQDQKPDNNTRAEILRDIINKYLTALRNKEQYCTRSFSIGESISQRNFLTTNNPDVVVEFNLDNDFDSPETMAMQNMPNRMIYFMGQKYRENKRLFNAFYQYCQFRVYAVAFPPNGEEAAKTRNEFAKRYDDLYTTLIVPEFKKILDACPVISGLQVIDALELGTKTGNDRYSLAMQRHLGSIYTKANLVNDTMPRNSEALRKAILRPVQPGDYEGPNAILTTAEKEVDIYLTKQPYPEVNVTDVVAKFSRAPYGWDNNCTLYVVNELVRRHNRDYSYGNNPNVETSLVAARLLSETNKFTLREAKAIPTEVIQNFTAAWKDIFGVADCFTTSDSTQIFRLCREVDSKISLAYRRDRHNKILGEIGTYAFAQPMKDEVSLFGDWLAERDPLKFFHAVIDKRTEARELIDRCKEVIQFYHDQLANYKSLLAYVRDNQLNFPFLKGDDQEKSAQLAAIENDEWPIPNMRHYLKLQKEVKYALDLVRKELKEKITAAYTDVCQTLAEAAEKNKVPVSILTPAKTVITQKTAPSNLLALEHNLMTDDFYQKEVTNILDYVERHKPTPPKTDPTDPPVPQKKIRKISLDTKTTTPINTRCDLDDYLDKLRKQIVREMDGGNSVMIIK